MDVQYVNPFIRAIRNVFSTMLKTEVNVQKPHVRHDGRASADVSGIVGFTGGATGCVVLSFPRDVACRTASAFAGTKITPDSADLVDAIGELANMVAGSAKKDLQGIGIIISPPSVIVGEDHIVTQSRMVPRLVIPCCSLLGDFYVEVAVAVDKAVVAR